jgi:surfeit locus 1 family protein
VKRIVYGLIAVLGIAGLTALGVWQLERRAWKLDLIERVEQRIHAAPTPAPGPGEWQSINAATAEYRRVSASGHYLNDRETLVQAVTKLGAGFWVVTPFKTDQGFIVLVNRGFVPADRRQAATRVAGQIAGATSVTGLLRLSEPKGGFLRANDPAGNRWYSRDVTAISAHLGLSPQTAPYFIDAGSTPNAGGMPVGGLTVIAFPNNHLQYAVTWFALALMLAGWAVLVMRHEKRIREKCP